MIKQRIIAMRTSFCRYAGLWKSTHVSFQIRRTVFQSVINGAARQDASYMFSAMQWKQLESGRMCLLWRAFAREAYSHTDKLRTLSDNTLRRRLSFPTLESVTRERRLKWYQSMLARLSHHTIYWATLLVSFEWENVADFELNGSLSHRALPALRQLTDDLTRLLPSWPGFVWRWVPAFLEHDLSGVSRCDSVVVPVSDEPFEDVQGLKFTPVQHNSRDVFAQNHQSNTCPRGKSIFSPEKSVNDLHRRNLKSKTCAKPRGAEASHVPSRRRAESA